MQSPTAGPAAPPTGLRTTREEMEYVVQDVARRDPTKAWELRVQFSISEHLDDITVLLGVVAVLSLLILGVVVAVYLRV